MTPDNFELLRRTLKRDEGIRLLPYTDTQGRLSIGYGRNLTDRGITQVEAGELLQNDMTVAVQELQRGFPFVLELDGVRQVVLASMTFNLGITRIAKFSKMWAALRAGKFDLAAVEMLGSTWAEQVGERAERLAKAMATGVLPL